MVQHVVNSVLIINDNILHKYLELLCNFVFVFQTYQRLSNSCKIQK